MKLNYILSLFLICIIGLNAQVDPGTDNLTHLWTFEDGTTNDQIGDASGEINGNNMDIIDGDLVSYPNTDGVGDTWLDLPGDIIDLGSYNEVAISAWFTPDSMYNTQWNTLWFFGDDGGGTGFGSDGMALQVRRGDGHARFWFTAGVSQGFTDENGVNDTAYGDYNRNVLYHVVCQVSSDGLLSMYHDGELVDTASLTTNSLTGETKSIADISPNFARFFHSTYSGDFPWVGAIHEIAIFNKLLSDEEVLFLFNEGVTAVEDQNGQLPETFSLLQNYPNPFNPSTTIRFSLPSSGFTSLKVYDVLGKEVATLVNGMRKAGMNSVQFNAPYSPSGIYFYTLQSGSFTETKKMVLVK
jgi:hypothetical protein